MMNEQTSCKGNETFEPVLTKKDLNRCGLGFMMGTATFNYETQMAPSVVMAEKEALRKIYKDDDEGYRASLANEFKYFNITPYVGGLLLGACLAIEERDHRRALDAVQDLKVGLMGSLSGVADTIFWILIPTIFSSLAAYMAQSGNTVGMWINIAIQVCLIVWKLKNWNIGYRLGTTLITSLTSKIPVFTEAMSILGLTVVGALIPSVISIKTGLTFTMGEVSLGVQEGILDLILIGLLPVVATAIIYALIRKKVNMNLIIIGIIVVSMIGAAFEIFTV